MTVYGKNWAGPKPMRGKGWIVFASKNHYKKNRRKKPVKLGEFLTKAAKRLRRVPTEAESVFMAKLEVLDIPYFFQVKYSFKGFGGIVDFYLPDSRLFVEVDGGYHQSLEQQEKDRVKDWICSKYLRIPVRRITNENVIEWDAEKIRAYLFQGQVIVYA